VLFTISRFAVERGDCNYICETDQAAIIYSTPTAAINETYKKLFNVQTQYSGLLVIRFDDEKIAEELRVGVLFFPLKLAFIILQFLFLH
jgi:hypothetical protein